MAKKAAQVVEDDEDETVELEELETDADEAPAKGKAKAASDEGWGVRDLIKLIKSKTEKEYSPREVRTLLRKLARDGGKINREVVAGNKTRYVWSGPDDPEVKVILKAVKGGEIEASKKAALDKLKSDKAAKTAAKATAEEPKKKGKTAPPPADDDDEDEDDD